ncbi:hypothetical protein UWK_00702 [Desulfocapsa sulfexigens DSM 10523]|uniref:Uncharacterized protein n=1 Tax=Desulfocapsa sulfexigens (strain DSM 10523 / SB164P1) TaxID=1167006 RepID=M1PBZ1_DESSD|nr:hypothetical protein UWK_00702 [Desulfocapsa sulfexigens DSM 10523]
MFDALAASPKHFIRRGQMALKYKIGILNYFAHRTTIGSVEDILHKIS